MRDELTPAQIDELGRRIFKRVEGLWLSPAQVREVVALEVVAYERDLRSGIAEAVGSVDRVVDGLKARGSKGWHEMSDAEFRAVAAERASRLIPDLTGMPAPSTVAGPEGEKLVRDMSPGEFRAHAAAKADVWVPGDELGPAVSGGG